MLDAVLASDADAVGLGELQNRPQAGWRGDDYCGCGIRVNPCRFWTAVRDRWSAHTGAEPSAYLDLQLQVSRRRSLPRRVTPALLNAGWSQTDQTLISSLFWSMSREAGGSTQKSWQREPERGIQEAIAMISAPKVARSWNLVNGWSDRVRRRGETPAAIRVRYEDMLADPADPLAAIGEITSMDFSEVTSRIDNQDPISFGHVVAGNRPLMQNSAPGRRVGDGSERIDDATGRIPQNRCRRGMARYGDYPLTEDSSMSPSRWRRAVQRWRTIRRKQVLEFRPGGRT